MALTLISTPLDITASDSAVTTVTVTSGIDSTYLAYEFHFVNIHPSNWGSILAFQVEQASGSSYAQTIHSSTWLADHSEADDYAELLYRTNRDQQNGTDYQQIGEYIVNSSNDNDGSGSGILTLHEPSSGTFVKHWIATFNSLANNSCSTSYHAGYINTQTAITKIRFSMVDNGRSPQGDFQAGTIKMFGVL